MTTLDEFLQSAAEALGLEAGDVHRDVVLDLARDVAHGVARPAAPVASFLVGLAAGRQGGSPDAVRAAAAAVTRLAAASEPTAEDGAG